MSTRRTVYTDDFFVAHETAVVESAHAIVPILLHLIRPKTVVDVGCGRGEWLSVFREHGISVRGFDGVYVDRARLFIPEDCFAVCDLSKPFHMEVRGDLACCLEVAEHLPEHMARSLIKEL